jgi:uncharacterized membrane protein YphA (DoxX/SURF4 family)
MAGAASSVAQLLIAQLAVFLALLLAGSAVHKLWRWGRSVTAAQEFARLPAIAAAPAVAAAAFAEVLSAALIMAPGYRAAGACLAVALFAVYLALIGWAISEGRRDVDCGCSFGAARRDLGAFEALRNALLLLCALIVAGSGKGTEPALASQVLAGCAFLALYSALDQVMGLQPMRKGTVL